MFTFILGLIVGIILAATSTVLFVLYVNNQAEKRLEQAKEEYPDKEVILEEPVNINPEDYIKPDTIWVDKDWGDTNIKITQVSPGKNRIRFVYLLLNGKSTVGNNIQEHSMQTLLHAYKPKLTNE